MIFYIGYYLDRESKEKRRVFLSAVNKMDYVIHTLDQMGYAQQVVSCAVSSELHGYPASTKRLGKQTTLKLFRSHGRKSIVTKALDLFGIRIKLFFYLMKHVKANDTLLVYHSCYYSKLLPLVKRLKKCRLVLELEEIYSDVSGDAKTKKKELYICRHSDAFVFPTALLNNAVNPEGKPSIAIHGTYQVESFRGERFADGKIHCVYAGTLDPRKVAQQQQQQQHIFPQIITSIFSALDRMRTSNKCGN